MSVKGAVHRMENASRFLQKSARKKVAIATGLSTLFRDFLEYFLFRLLFFSACVQAEDPKFSRRKRVWSPFFLFFRREIAYFDPKIDNLG